MQPFRHLPFTEAAVAIWEIKQQLWTTASLSSISSVVKRQKDKETKRQHDLFCKLVHGVCNDLVVSNMIGPQYIPYLHLSMMMKYDQEEINDDKDKG